jgi:hypothetical protein
MHKGRELRKRGPLQQCAECTNRRRATDRSARQHTSVQLCDFGEEIVGEYVVATEIKKIIIGSNGNPSQNTLPYLR